jgi:hypothetical protein
VVYALTMTAAVIYWVMSLDPTWYSSVYGLLFLVGQGYSVLALLDHRFDLAVEGRAVQDHPAADRAARPGQVHLRLCDAEHLSGLLAVPHHLVGQPAGRDSLVSGSHSRHWGIIITLDFIFHWLIPFTLLLSRDLKRNKKRLMRVCQWMVFAKAFDLFWLIEPNFKDAARNLHFSWGILEYAAVPVAMVAFWVAFFCTR